MHKCASNLTTQARRYSPGRIALALALMRARLPTTQTGGSFGEGPAHSYCKAICYPRQTIPSLCTPTSVCFNCQWSACPSKFLAFFVTCLVLMPFGCLYS